MKWGWSLLALVVSTAASANEFGNLPQVKKITNGQPEDVVALIERIVECNHWGGEEPYDKERTEWIKKAVERARCGSLDSEEQIDGAKIYREQEGSQSYQKGNEINDVSKAIY